MTPAWSLTLRDFAIAAPSLWALSQVSKVLGGTPLMPFTWQDFAIPIGAAVIFCGYRHARRGGVL